MTSEQPRRRKRESPEKKRNRLVAEVRQLRQDELGALRRIAEAKDTKDGIAERFHDAALRGIRSRRDQLVPQIERLSARIERDENGSARSERKRRSAKRPGRESRPQRGVPGRSATNPA